LAGVDPAKIAGFERASPDGDVGRRQVFEQQQLVVTEGEEAFFFVQAFEDDVLGGAAGAKAHGLQRGIAGLIHGRVRVVSGTKLVDDVNGLRGHAELGHEGIELHQLAAIHPGSGDEVVKLDAQHDFLIRAELSGEFLLRAYGRLYGIHGTALRFFNIYGERQDPNSAYSGVISIFVNRLKAGQGISIFGDGYQSRDFVYVRDLAAFITSLVPKTEVPDLMNVGTGTSVTLRDLVEELEGILGIRAEVTFGEPRAGDIMISRANVSRMRSLWDSPMTPLSIGLARLVSSLETR
jgi:hypothetical protein